MCDAMHIKQCSIRECNTAWTPLYKTDGDIAFNIKYHGNITQQPIESMHPRNLPSMLSFMKRGPGSQSS